MPATQESLYLAILQAMKNDPRFAKGRAQAQGLLPSQRAVTAPTMDQFAQKYAGSTGEQMLGARQAADEISLAKQRLDQMKQRLAMENQQRNLSLYQQQAGIDLAGQQQRFAQRQGQTANWLNVGKLGLMGLGGMKQRQDFNQDKAYHAAILASLDTKNKAMQDYYNAMIEAHRTPKTTMPWEQAQPTQQAAMPQQGLMNLNEAPF